MIEVYPSRLTDKGKETYKVKGRQLLVDWLYANGIDKATRLDMLPMSLYVNGDRLLPSQWKTTHFTNRDKVEIYREPKGTDPFSITFALLFGAKAVLSALMPKMPTAPGARNGAGEALDEASAKGNKVKLNQVIPECFGFNPQRYPDYLVVPRRYFAAPREQRIEMMLAVGRGSYDIELSAVKVGQTTLLSLGDDASFTIYGPGADLSSDPAHLFWYPAPEVGTSSTGAAGLELTVSTDLTPNATASVFVFDNDTVTIPVGAGSFPADWTSGLLLAIAAPYGYTVDDGTGTGGRDVINGPVAQLGFTNGDLIEIQGNNAGQYTVFSQTAGTLQLDYPGGAPATGLVTGPVTMAIAYTGQRFRIISRTDQVLTVERIKNDGTADTTWPGWDSLSSNQGQVRLDSSNLQGGYRGPFPACPQGEKVVKIEYDVFFAGGLTGLGREGQFYMLETQHTFEWRDMAVGGLWNTVTQTMSGDSPDAKGFSFQIDLPYPMRPECRIKRLPTQIGRVEEAQDDSMWYGLKGLMVTSPTSYEGITTISVNIRGGDRISAQSESLINLACTRILPILRSGVWQGAVPTREISAAVGQVVRDVGYSDTADLDIVELENLEATRWTPRGDTYDRVITEADTVKGILQEILQAGFAQMTIDRGVLTPVRDELRGPEFNSVYNPQVMLEPLEYEFKLPEQPDDFNGVDVEYFSHATLQTETIQCRLPGDAGTRVETIKVDGVGVDFRAWRIGMRRRREHIYRQREYTFQTELDALNSGYYDYVALGVTTPGYGQSAELEDYELSGPGAIITSTEPLDWTKPGEYKVLVRRYDGTASGPYVATMLDKYNMRIPVPLDFVPDLGGDFERPIIQFGHEDTWCFPALITDIQPQGTRTCKVTAVNYDPRMYADDDNFPPDD